MEDSGSARTLTLVGKVYIDNLDRTAQSGTVKPKVGNGEHMGNFPA